MIVICMYIQVADDDSVDGTVILLVGTDVLEVGESTFILLSLFPSDCYCELTL